MFGIPRYMFSCFNRQRVSRVFVRGIREILYGLMVLWYLCGVLCVRCSYMLVSPPVNPISTNPLCCY